MRGKRTPTDQLDGLSILVHILRNNEKKTLQAIGKMLGKDHSTILYHIKRYDTKWQTSRKFRQAEKDFKIVDFVESYSHKKINISDLTIENVQQYFVN